MQVGNQNVVQIRKVRVRACFISSYSWWIAKVHCIFTFHLYSMESSILSQFSFFLFYPQNPEVLLLETWGTYFSFLFSSLLWVKTFCPRNWKVSFSADCLTSMTITVSPSNLSHGYCVKEDAGYRKIRLLCRE